MTRYPNRIRRRFQSFIRGLCHPQWPRRMVVWLIRHGYGRVVSPLWRRGKCRFFPSCSTYALQAIERYGVIRGGILALWRIGRCHPWGGHGIDPVPEDFRWPWTKQS